MAYGYVGDATPDNNSLLGIGNSKFALKPGSLIPEYSAALTLAEAKRRGLDTSKGVASGEEFSYKGKTYRWDDTFGGDSSYVDVYTPDHAPDKGVSPGEIARQSAIAAKRPGATDAQIRGATPSQPQTVTVKKTPEQLHQDTTYHVDSNGEKHDTETGDIVSDDEAAERARAEEEVKQQQQPVVEPESPPVRIITPQPAVTFGTVPKAPISPAGAPVAPVMPIAPFGTQNA